METGKKGDLNEQSLVLLNFQGKLMTTHIFNTYTATENIDIHRDWWFNIKRF